MRHHTSAVRSLRSFKILSLAAVAATLALVVPGRGRAVSDPVYRIGACYAPGTDPRLVEQYETRFSGSPFRHSLERRLAEFQYTDGDRWTTTATNGGGLRQGDPTTLTWSIVPDGMSVFGYGGEPTSNSNLRSFLNSIYGNEAGWLPVMERVFTRWGDLTGITYVYEPNDDGARMTQMSMPGGQLGVRGDIRIAGHRIDGSYNILAYNFFPAYGGDMIIDTADTFLMNSGNDSIILRNTLAHEHGHGIGIEHVCPINETKLMEPYLSLSFDGPQHDDILAANRAYGDNNEHDDSRAAALDIGALVPGSDVTITDRSVDDTGDHDYVAFKVNSSITLDVELDPVGSTYRSGQQNGDGSCSSGTNFNSLAVRNLRIELLDSVGTVLASANANPAGSGEIILAYPLAASASSYYVHVAGDTKEAAQLYTLELRPVSSSSPQPILYQSADATSVKLPPNAVGPVSTSPFSLTPKPDPLLFYEIEHGAGFPSVIYLVKSGSTILVYF